MTQRIRKMLHLFQQLTQTDVIRQVYCNRKKQVAITFDDGYGNTLQILEKLQHGGGKATFFLVGEWMECNKDLCKSIVDRGHEIGNHTYNHCKLKEMPKEDAEREIMQAQELLFQITGQNNKLFRFPYSSCNRKLLRLIHQKGMASIGWTIDTRDWEGIGAEQIYGMVINDRKVEAGSIVLMHTTGQHTVEALDRIIPALKAEGYELVKVSDLFRSTSVYKRFI